MQAFAAWFQQLNFDVLWELLVTVGACLLCITFHETCHGLAALALGDPTAKRAGRLSLNPMKHIDFVGLVMLAVAKFGWAKPVPVNMRNFKNPKVGMAVTALAGPVSNLLLAWAATMLYAAAVFYYNLTGHEVLYWVCSFLLTVVYLSVGLAVFNFLPIPPLDGSKVLLAALLLTGVLDTPLAFARGLVIDVLNAVGLWPYDVLYGIYF